MQLLTIKTLAQTNDCQFELGANIGTFVYQGDLSAQFYGSLNRLRPTVGLYAMKHLNRNYGLRANLYFGKVNVDGALEQSNSGYQKNFAFTTRITELSLVVVRKFQQTSEGDERRLVPYVFAGAGVAFVDITRDFSRFDQSLFDPDHSTPTAIQQDRLRRLPRTLLVIPIGAGIKYRISNVISAHAEGTYRFTNSDYLDGYSKAVNPKSLDSYYGVSAGVGFSIFNNRVSSCPKRVI